MPFDSLVASTLLDVVNERDRLSDGALGLTSQYPIDHRHAFLGDPTIADAILDRLVSGTMRINLKGESMRKLRSEKV